MNSQLASSAQPAVNQMLEMFKFQYIMKSFDTSKGGIQSIALIFILLAYDQIVKYIPIALPVFWAWFSNRFQKRDETIATPLLSSITLPPPPTKEIRAFIQFERAPDQKVIDQRIESVLYHVCNLPEVRSLRFNGVEMIPNFKEFIMIDNDIWFQVLNPSQGSLATSASSQAGQPKIEPILYKLATYDHDITWLHRFVEQSIERYEQEKKNNLGNEMYYFDHIVTAGPFGNPLSKEFCSFRKSKFFSNRTLNNIYLKQSDELKHRVDFFMKRRDWYDSKGIPHTLGIVMYGHPGCGKTSTIKAIANETRRHIFNIMLSEIKTKQALKDLFYNDAVHTMTDGKLQVLNIPVKQRLYVIEDVDAMNSVVIKRTAEQIQKDAERKLKLEAEKEILKEKQGITMANKMMEGREDSESDKLDLATLLNVLDGVRETPGRIIVLSTNYPERLDQALLRPGRFDILLEYEKHNNEVLILHVERFYDIQLTKEQKEKLMAPSLYHKWTPAEVGQILFKNILSVEGAIHDLVEEAPEKLFKFSRIEEEKAGTSIEDILKECGVEKDSLEPVTIDTVLKVDMKNDENKSQNIEVGKEFVFKRIIGEGVKLLPTVVDEKVEVKKSVIVSDSDSDSDIDSWSDMFMGGGMNAVCPDPPSEEQIKKASEVRNLLFGYDDNIRDKEKMLKDVTDNMLSFQEKFKKEFGLSGYSASQQHQSLSDDVDEDELDKEGAEAMLESKNSLP